MDRRQALKKLGVGGAVAVSAPVLLDAFNVAHASTAFLPSTGEVLASTSVVPTGGNGDVTFVLDVAATSPVIWPAGTSFTWSNVVSLGNVVSIKNGAGGPEPRFTGGTTLEDFTVDLLAQESVGTPSSARYTFTFASGAITGVTVVPL